MKTKRNLELMCIWHEFYINLEKDFDEDVSAWKGAQRCLDCEGYNIHCLSYRPRALEAKR
jgi:hypothetical protein